MSTLANHHPADQTVNVVKLTDKLFAHACQRISVVHQDADQNVFLVPNAHKQRLVSIRNVSILAQELAEQMPFAELTITVQSVHVKSVTLVILLPDVTPLRVSHKKISSVYCF